MSARPGLFGAVAQLGYVVPDLTEAVGYWTGTLGIGPFLVVRDLALPAIVYRGETKPLTMSVAYSHSGGVQIELIEAGTEPSIYTEAIDAGWVGVHHVGYFVDDFAAAERAALGAGFDPIQSGAFGGTAFSYFDTGRQGGGALIELIETSPAKAQRFDAIRRTAEAWTGEQPIRETAVAQLQRAETL